MNTCEYHYKTRDENSNFTKPCGICQDCKEHIENNNTDKWHP